MAFDLGGLLQKYLNVPAGQTAPGAEQHFDQVAQHAPPEVLGQGISDALRSDATPPLGQMVGDVYSKASPDQQAGMLNQILASLPQGALSSLGGGALSSLEDELNTGVEEELRATLDELADDQLAETLALAWVGRGTYDSTEWDDAFEEANTLDNEEKIDELLDMPLLAGHLEAGLAAFDFSCDGVGQVD